MSPTELQLSSAESSASLTRTSLPLTSDWLSTGKLLLARKNVVNQLKTVTYSRILDLPPEILAQIFLEAWDAVYITVSYEEDENDYPHAPLSVGRPWRNVPLNLPKLWSMLMCKPQARRSGRPRLNAVSKFHNLALLSGGIRDNQFQAIFSF
ncbi:F-box domain-containing protein [Mycena kentingensis (nom. inval.)]|nr:F-box domain-containing protein [Mycena kentingensis (nom. inval.)]